MQKIIAGQDGYPNTPWYSITSAAEWEDLSPLIVGCVWEGPATLVYKANDGELSTFAGAYHYVGIKRMTPPGGTGQVYTLDVDANNIAVFAYSIKQGNNLYTHRVLWVIYSDYDTAVSVIVNNTWNSDNILYQATDQTSEFPDFLTEERSWDNTPSEDPDDPTCELPQGGEYADLGPYDETWLMELSSIPNPEITMNMSWGSMIVTYVLTAADMLALGNGLFMTGFWTSLKNKFEGLSDPLSMIVNAIQVPFDLAGTSQTFKLGGVEVENGEGHPIACVRTNTRYKNETLGSVTLKEVWGSSKDYTDCSVEIYLPYVGVKELDPDVVIGCTCTLVCNIDCWTGDLVYMLHVSNADATKKYFTAQSVPYRWSGNCAKKVPLGRVDNSNMILSMLGTIGGIGLGAATMGIGAAGAIGGMGLASSGMAGATGMAAGLTEMKIGAGIAGATAAKALHSGFKPTVQSSSGIQGAPGQMDYQVAYIMVKRGVPKYPNNWRAQIGAPNYQTFQGVSMEGFTLFSEIHLTGMSDASEAERQELERILCEEGVIL